MYLAFTELGGRDPNKNCPILKYLRIQLSKHLWKPEGKSFCKSILFYGIRWHPHVSQVSPHNLKLGKPYSESSERLCLECLPQFDANDWKVQTTINFWPKTFFAVCDSAEYAWLKWIIPIQVNGWVSESFRRVALFCLPLFSVISSIVEETLPGIFFFLITPR